MTKKERLTDLLQEAFFLKEKIELNEHSGDFSGTVNDNLSESSGNMSDVIDRLKYAIDNHSE